VNLREVIMHKRLRWAVVVLALVVTGWLVFGEDSGVVHLGIVADVHAHVANSPVEDKVMTNYAERLSAFVAAMNGWPADVVIELGDLVNGTFVMGPIVGDTDTIAGLLDEAIRLLSAFDGPVHYVPGNHDFYTLSKEDFLQRTGRERAYYSFDLGGFHFVVLDAEYNDDGTDYDHVFMRVKGAIPPVELDWLKSDLAQTTKPTVVCVHQPLDADYEDLAGGPPIVNHEDVQRVLTDSGVVIAVFQGHDHENRLTVIDEIPYVTFAAMVDHYGEPTPPTWAQVTLDPLSQTITIDGAGLQENWELSYELNRSL
jgi:3',5'-cyclic AMP phosphodiesterase CpdA